MNIPRIDHLAWRVPNRKETAQFFIDVLGYRIQTEFDLNFPDGSTTKCIALEAFEKKTNFTWKQFIPINGFEIEYWSPPEFFISDGDDNSIVGKWVNERKNIGSFLHHIALQVDDVEKTAKEWLEKGYAEFATEKALTCPGLIQIFSKPHKLTGIIFELIKRENQGFCKENVIDLMTSSADFK